MNWHACRFSALQTDAFSSLESQAALSPRVQRERSARRRPHGVVRTAAGTPEWSTAGTTDILPAVHIPKLFTYRR